MSRPRSKWVPAHISHKNANTIKTTRAGFWRFGGSKNQPQPTSITLYTTADGVDLTLLCPPLPGVPGRGPTHAARGTQTAHRDARTEPHAVRPATGLDAATVSTVTTCEPHGVITSGVGRSFAGNLVNCPAQQHKYRRSGRGRDLECCPPGTGGMYSNPRNVS